MPELGRIIPEKAYQTTDGRIFTGKDAKEKAEDHQRYLNNGKPKKKRKKKTRKTR